MTDTTALANLSAGRVLIDGQCFLEPGAHAQLQSSPQVDELVVAGTLGAPERAGYGAELKEDLEREVARRREAGREITVDGSGAHGNVTKEDLVAALEADDATK